MVQPDTPPFAPLSCQPSVTGLHSQPGHHRAIVSTLSNPDHPLSARMDAVLSSASSAYAEEPNRTALSSPGPAGPMTILDLSPSRCGAQTQQSGSEVEGEPSSVVVGPSSVGLKRRLLAPLHGKSGDYLRTLQRTGGSLDRRLNLELFNSPKRKVSDSVMVVYCLLRAPFVVQYFIMSRIRIKRTTVFEMSELVITSYKA